MTAQSRVVEIFDLEQTLREIGFILFYFLFSFFFTEISKTKNIYEFKKIKAFQGTQTIF